MTIPTITPISDPPSRSDPVNFPARADAFLGALPQFSAELNTFADAVNDISSEFTQIQGDVEAAYGNVLGAANVVKWVSGSTHAEGVVVFSPSNYQNYRRTASLPGSSTVDPASDGTRWIKLTSDLSTSVNVAGNLLFGSSAGSGFASLIQGSLRTANGGSNFDMISSLANNTTYDFRILRSSGENGNTTLTHRGTGNLELRTEASAPIIFNVWSAERARFTSSGQFVIGHTATLTGVGGTGITVASTGFAASMSVARYSADAGSPSYIFAKSRSAGVNGQSPVLASDGLGTIQFNGSDGTTMVTGAQIVSSVEGTTSSGNVGANISLRTRDSGGTLKEAVRVDRAGNTNLVLNSSATPISTNSTMTFALTSNTNLRISVRGTDGVVRVANITLS